MKTDRELIIKVHATDDGAWLEPLQELIRCKECKYFNGDGTWCDIERVVSNEDFCSSAERKE